LSAIWKEYKLLKRISKKTALEYAKLLSMVFRGIEVVSIAESEEEVLKMATALGITVYDASYLYLAVRKGFILVTDDKKLKEKASKYVKVLTTDQLIH
jgi:predicted nucleic acid-binding protein